MMAVFASELGLLVISGAELIITRILGYQWQILINLSVKFLTPLRSVFATNTLILTVFLSRIRFKCLDEPSHFYALQQVDNQRRNAQKIIIQATFAAFFFNLPCFFEAQPVFNKHLVKNIINGSLVKNTSFKINSYLSKCYTKSTFFRLKSIVG